MRPKLAQLIVPGVAAARALGGFIRRYAAPLGARLGKDVNGGEPITVQCESISLTTSELGVVGWAVARSGIRLVEVFVDDSSVGPASYGIGRPDVHACHPELSGAELSGFILRVPLAPLNPAPSHRVRVVVSSFAGQAAEYACDISPRTRVTGDHASAVREPPPAELGTSLPPDELSLNTRVGTAREDQSADFRSNGASARSVEPVAESSRNPRVEPLPSSRAAGPAASGGPNQQFFFNCDEPAVGDEPCVFGSSVVRGWALVESGLARVTVYVDDVEVGTARLGTARPDVAAAHPGWLEADHAGWQMSWDTKGVPDGMHALRIRLVSRMGAVREVRRTVVVDNTTRRATPYERWVELFESRDIVEAHSRSASLRYRPRISIVTPVYNVDPLVLQRTIESVRDQAYTNWQLCLCDDGSQDAAARRILTEAAANDERICVDLQSTNAGISAATNRALALADGQFVALLDADDLLAPHALYFIAKALNADPTLDLLYSDEDKVDSRDSRYEPFFKPDFSPDLLLSMNYICHLMVVRTELLRELGGFQSAYDGSQDYDVTLRVVERTQRIFHVPKVLYHWRAVSGSTATNPTARMWAHTAARRAIEAHLERSETQATVEPGVSLGRWRVRYALPDPPDVSLIVPCGGKVELLQECLTTVLQKTNYPRYRIVVVDNSKAEDVRAVVAGYQERSASVTWVDFRDRPFNFALLNNHAVSNVESPLVLFLNDDCVPIDDGWLEAMVEHAVRPEVGAVGAKLLYPDGTLQHAGVVMGIYDNSGHSFKNLPGSEREPVYFDLPHVIRNTSAVTAACLMTRRELFLEVGGFDDVHLAVAFQDTDFCLKLREHGYRIIYTPHARLFHFESKTKDEKIPNSYEVWCMRQRWAHAIAHDPCYNVNLTRRYEDYALCVDD